MTATESLPDRFKPSGHAYQDLFAYVIHGCVSHGTFLDVGCADPIIGSNSYALETQCGWRGICIDKNDYASIFAEQKRSGFVQGDAISIDWTALLKERELASPIGYLSLDVDQDTFLALLNVLRHQVCFNVATVEHDVYCRGKPFQDELRDVLWKEGYHLICADVMCNGYIFEDWWVNSACVKHAVPYLSYRKDFSSIFA